MPPPSIEHDKIIPAHMEDGWYVVDRNNQYFIHRGPYKHSETAGAVRQEMEMSADERKRWNLWVVEKKSLKTDDHSGEEKPPMESARWKPDKIG